MSGFDTGIVRFTAVALTAVARFPNAARNPIQTYRPPAGHHCFKKFAISVVLCRIVPSPSVIPCVLFG